MLQYIEDMLLCEIRVWHGFIRFKNHTDLIYIQEHINKTVQTSKTTSKFEYKHVN